MQIKICGVYEIRNILNNNIYIGSSIDISKRWKEHIRDLNADRHCNSHFQRAWNKYGSHNFKFKILETCEPIKDTILHIEQKYLDLDPVYNICTKAGNTLGFRYSEESKKKLSEANRKRIIKKSTIEKHRKNALNSEYNKKQRKKVDMFTLEGELINTFNSLQAAAIYMGNKNKRINIRRVCRGISKKAYGYVWKFKN